MRLSRIRIERLKQFREPIEIQDLQPGLNLFTGANEAGKSTVVTAIRAAFFERYRSGSVEDLRPWGDSSASPTVELEFAIAGTHHTLMKSFLGKKRCELQAGTQRFDGADAEDHLASLLGFQHAAKGASKAEHWGIPGLLWIAQGTAHDIKDSVAHATDHLRTALKDSLGEVASSSGDQVLAAIEGSRNELLTATTGVPRGPYGEAIKLQAQLEQEIERLDAHIAAYRQNVDTLAALRQEQATDEAQKPWESLREQERAAVTALQEIEHIELTLDAQRQRLKQVEERIVLFREQLEAFARQDQEVARRIGALETAQAEHSGAQTLVGSWQSNHEQATRHAETARGQLRLARQEDTRRNHARELEVLQSQAASFADTLANAESERAALLELQALAAASAVAHEDIDTLRRQDQQLRELRIQQQAAATRLHFALDDGCHMQIAGESINGAGERLLVQSTTIILPDFGKLEISPGGADLAQLKQQEIELSDRHTALLQRLGLPSLEAAEQRHQTHARQQSDIKAANATLKTLAPRGIEALRAELAVKRVRIDEIRQALQQLPPSPDGVAAQPTVAQAEAAEDDARQALAGVNESLGSAQIAASKAHNALQAAMRELENAQALINAPDRVQRLASANASLTDARAEQAALNERIATLSAQVAEARPDILKQDVERFGGSAKQYEKSFNDRRERLMQLDAALQSAGAQGLEERRAELMRDHLQAERRIVELKRRALALDYLLNLLREKRRALTRRLQAPLQKHLNRYLQLLFPQARLEIDENLSPGPLTRGNGHGTESGAFETLSFGAREQMGVISRLAYADLLREAGRPTLIILDDALVHSDDTRLTQMKRVLFDAATRHQILLFTCHPGRWRDLGVAARPLETFKTLAA